MSGKQRRVYKCGTCARVFKRSEHCSRHERIHTRERPFSCQYCHKRYARKDLVTRHEKTLHSEKRRQSIATAVPEFPDSRRSSEASESSETINASIPSKSSSLPDLSHSFEREPEVQPVATPVETAPPVITSPEVSPYSLAIAHDRRNSQMLLPVDVSAAPFSFGTTVEALYPSPQSCSEQAQGAVPSWGEQLMGLAEVPIQNAYLPIDPQLCEPQQHLDLNMISHSGSQGSPIAVPSVETRNDSMDATQDSMGPPSKRRRLTKGGSQAIDTQRASRQDWHHQDLDSASVDIFRDFWSPPEPPSDMARNSTGSMMTPDSLEFSIPIDPFLMGGQDFSPHQQDGFSSNVYLGNSSQDLGFNSWQAFLEGPSKVSDQTSSDPPKLMFDDSIYRSICGDLQARLNREEWDQNKLPNAQELEKFLESYICCFHRHFPVVHIPSLDLESAPSPLTLAICCVGAMYRLDRRRADILYDLASPLLHSAVAASRKVRPPSPSPLWAVQGCLLLAMYAVFSGRPALVLSNLEKTGFFIAEYRLRRTSLVADVKDEETSWKDWVNQESNKRLLCGILIMSNLISVTYGANPWFSVGEDLQVELPANDNLWDAPSSSSWADAKKRGKTARVTVMDALSNALSQHQHELPPTDEQRASGFANLVTAHAANIHVWHLSQLSQCFDDPAGTSSHAHLISDVSTSLDRAHSALNPTAADSSSYKHPYSTPATASLHFNTTALLRIASTRLHSTPNSFNRFVLTSSSPHELATAITSFLATPLLRTAPTTRAARDAAEGFRLPVKVGPLLVRKTAAFGWSIEHAVAWWDMALFLTRWVHAVEMEEEELVSDGEGEEAKVLEGIRGTLREMEEGEEAGAEGSSSSSLAAGVARACKIYLEDTWVWGGELLNACLRRGEMADEYVQ